MKRILPALLLCAGLAACDKDPSRPDPFEVGGTLQLNVNAFQNCENPEFTTGRVVARSQRAIFVEDAANPAGGFTAAEYQAIGAEFDNLIYPTNVANFGEPSDIDKNGRVLVFYTRAVNKLTPAGVNFIVGGFFYGRDLFPRTTSGNLAGCAGSNRGEVFYMLAPDPNGEVNGNKRSKEYVREATIGTLAHEFEHLINASRRLYVNTGARFPEEVWLDEGLAHIAEELAFFARSGLGPRQNLDRAILQSSAQNANAFNDYASSNFGRFQEYLRDPPGHSPIEDDDDLATRGAAWSFLRYAADRRGGADQGFWFALVNSVDTGYTNLANRLGTDPQPFLRDWTMAHYADDAVPGAEARFQHLTWAMRNIYGTYPLHVRTLTNGAMTVSIRASSAAYFKFGVAPGTTGDVRVSAAGTTEGGACTTVTLAVGQVYQGGNTPSALCFGAGEYVLVPYFSSTSQAASTPVTVTAAGVVPPVGPPTPQLGPLAGPSLSLSAGRRGDGGFHHRLRERERELGDLVLDRPTGPSRSVAAAPAAGVVIQVIRTK